MMIMTLMIDMLPDNMEVVIGVHVLEVPAQKNLDNTHLRVSKKLMVWKLF